ncbi:MAG: biotin/lipoyl-binding protein [Planctomycetota bacterium]|nr:biotin/lipoyl-binding protein [Planctomycetota bacterium]
MRATPQVHRQHYRGQMWYVIQDASSNQFFRINGAAYQFVGMLDGDRTVSEVWAACNEQLGDSAPTQPEAIQLLGQLYTANLLASEMPGDAQSLLNRYRKRRMREVQGYLMNLLFMRIPLIDPDAFLSRWVGLFGAVFSKVGLVLWALLLGLGLHALAGYWDKLSDRANGILDVGNLPFLYGAFIFTKVFHEFGHAFACKKFGLRAGGGEVHAMGVMMLVFTPMPYVDASSAWAFRRKWHRIIVGAAGMMVELAIAAVAAFVWVATFTGKSPTALNALAFNVMFICSVSTLIFNGNPLLRFDGYYILSDLLEIPNLSQRANQYLCYLVKRYLWRVKPLRNPANTTGEKVWFVLFGVASNIYRVLVSVRILLFVADKIFLVGAIMAISAIVAWVFRPIGKFLRYLASNNELARVRTWAVASSAIFFLGLIAAVGVIPWPDRYRVEGIVKPFLESDVVPRTEGHLVRIVAPDGARVHAGDVLFVLENRELLAQAEQLKSRLKVLSVQLASAGAKVGRSGTERENSAMIAAIKVDIDAAAKELAETERQIADLSVRAKIDGVWIAPHLSNRLGEFIARDTQLGRVADLGHLILVAAAKQEVPVQNALEAVEARLWNRPDLNGGARTALTSTGAYPSAGGSSPGRSAANAPCPRPP